jgi:cyclopropane-fatty-acyl-phospholipid synthase
MTLLRTVLTHRSTPLFGRLFIALLNRIRIGHLVLVTPDGEQCVFGDPHAQPVATLQLHDWRACRAILRAGDIGFAEAYRAQWLDTPDLTRLLQLAIRNEDALRRTVMGGKLSQLWYGLRHRLRPNTRTGSRRNIHAHYDLGNDFYGLWLDSTWTYSSALFDLESAAEDRVASAVTSAAENAPVTQGSIAESRAGSRARQGGLSLERAQHAKYDRIVETLQLRAGMHVLEIGCGWGGFALHAARLGIHVHAVTISPEQFAMAKHRATIEPFEGQVQFELRDYRDLDGQYDAIVSIEMFEAVGERFWGAYFKVLKRCLAPGGRALVQSITIDEARFAAYRASSDFIREFVFPGGMLPSSKRFIAGARKADLCAETSLAFGRDYAHTLRHWRALFEAKLEAVREQGFDETFIRTWRLYLAYCEAAFEEKRTDVMQFVLRREGKDGF